ncbi:MAG TPA: SGNH/GDSL hydrolase family protein [Gemmatimonadaceae bacterium]
MSRVTNLVRGAAALAIVAGITACSTDAKVFGTTPRNDLFASYVALGNSITAGYQAGGISEATQRASYANLLAQAMETRFAMPIVMAPGCPPPLVNLAGSRGSSNGVNFTSTTCNLRNPAYVTDVLNNVAVPGATSLDPTSTSTAASNMLTNLVLGGRTQVQRALMADPTFATVWIGNNDVLSAAVSGFTYAVPNVTPGITPVATFNTNFDKLMSELTAGAPGIKGVLIGVVQVANIPHFIPAQLLFSPQYVAGLSALAGKAITPHPVTCSPTSTSLISFQIISAIKAGAHPAVISCDKSTAAAAPPYGEAYVLDAQDQAAIKAAVDAYNAKIKSAADAAGFAYWDPNPTLEAQRQAGGCIPPYPNLAAVNPTTGAGNPFGPCISLDGIHPADQGHKLVAEALRQAINAKYGTNLPAIQ